MANLIQWGAAWASRANVLTTQLNALTSAYASALGSVELDNSANLDQYFIAEFLSGASWTPGSGSPYLSLYAIPTADGTNYANNYTTGATPLLPAEHLVCSWSLPASTAGTHRVVSRMFSLGPGKYKFLLVNNGGAALPANTNTVAIYSANDELQ